MKISLCMIVKNEEEVLARCLDSVKSLVDEIVIIDTGSTDRTKELAQQYTPLVFDFVWRDDFASARNFAFSKATGDYLLWLDADDVLSLDEDAVRTLKALLEREAPDVVNCAYDVAFDEAGNPTYSYFRERFLKREANFVWVGRVHECIAPRGKIVTSPLRVRHLGGNKQKGSRNLDIYRRQILDGEKLSPRDLFYYGRELYYHKLYKEAVSVLEKMLKSDGWYVNKIEACKVLSRCRLMRGEGEEALKSLFQSFVYGAPRASVCCAAGNIFKMKKEYVSAAFWYESALSCADHSAEGDFEEPLCRSLHPLLELTCCYYTLGDHVRAVETHKKAEALFPEHPSVVYNRNFFHEKNLL